MHLLIISGFLGSGKTTVLLGVAKVLSEAGKKIAIIENEVGQTGIDGGLLSSEGLSVREIYSGCVCCSLRHDLIQTLLDLERDYDPDIVILEPSGVAGPKQVVQCLLGYGGEISGRTMLVLADAVRLPAIQDFSIPLVRDGVAMADLLLLNKSDQVEEPQLENLRRRLTDLRADLPIRTISALQQDTLKDLGQWLLTRCSEEVKASKEPVVAESEWPDATVYACDLPLDCGAGDQAFDRAEAVLNRIAGALVTRDGCLIGHIKASLKTKPTAYGVLSLTDIAEGVQRKGRLPAKLTECKMTLNAIAYGIDEESLTQICTQCLPET